MKTFGRYLIYRLRQSALRTAVFTVLSVLLSQAIIYDCNNYSEIEFNQTGIFTLAILLGIFSTLIPILETMCFKNRRNLDTLYFFPIKREKMALVHYLSGFIQVAFIYTVTFIAAFTYLALNTDYYALGYMFPYYLLSLIAGLVMYSVFIFVFNQANTVVDGVVFSVMWMFAIALVMFAVQQMLPHRMIETGEGYIRTERIDLVAEWGIIYMPINALTVIFQELIEVNTYHHSTYSTEILKYAWWFGIWAVLGIAATVGYFVTFVKKGAQKMGEISNSWFGYRTLVPLYGYSLLMLMGREGGDHIMIWMLFAAMIIGYIIYRRSFRLHTPDLVVTAAGIIPLVLSSL